MAVFGRISEGAGILGGLSERGLMYNRRACAPISKHSKSVCTARDRPVKCSIWSIYLPATIYLLVRSIYIGTRTALPSPWQRYGRRLCR